MLFKIIYNIYYFSFRKIKIGETNILKAVDLIGKIQISDI